MRGMRSLSGAAGASGPLRTDRDIPLWVVGIGSVAIVVVCALVPSFKINVLGALLILVLGFLFVTVSSRLTGEVGSSSNPISGMTVATPGVQSAALGAVLPQDLADLHGSCPALRTVRRLGHDALHVRGLRNVTADQVRLSAKGPDVAGDGLGGLAARVVVDQHSAAQTGECACRRGSDAGGRSGDEDDFSFEVRGHALLHGNECAGTSRGDARR